MLLQILWRRLREDKMWTWIINLITTLKQWVIAFRPQITTTQVDWLLLKSKRASLNGR